MITFSIFLIVFLVTVFIREKQYLENHESELEYLNEYEAQLGRARHTYYSTGSVAEAAPEVLEEGMPSHRFARLFKAVALPVYENGDAGEGTASLFLAAVLRIRQEIASERRFLKLMRHKYSGLAITAVWPLAAVPLIAYWASSALETLLPFYVGRWGYLTLFILATVSAFCFEGIDRFRSPVYVASQTRISKRVSGRWEYLIIGAIAFAFSVILTAERHIEACILQAEETGSVADFLIIPCCTVLAPALFKLLHKIDEYKDTVRRKDEQKRFRYVVEMLRAIPGVGPFDVLESMEIFSEKYRQQISKCLSDYATDSVQAVTELSKASGGELEDLCEAFLASEEVGVADAFDEITSQIEIIREEEENSRRIELDRNVLISEVLAGTPGVLILFGYLIIPFMAKAIAMFNTYQETLQDFISIT